MDNTLVTNCIFWCSKYKSLSITLYSGYLIQGSDYNYSLSPNTCQFWKYALSSFKVCTILSSQGELLSSGMDIVVKTHCIIHWIVSYLVDSVIRPVRMLGWPHSLTEVSAYFRLDCTYCIILIFNLSLKHYSIRWTWTESLCWKGLYGYQQSSLLHWKNTAVYKGHRKVTYENSSILNS